MAEHYQYGAMLVSLEDAKFQLRVDDTAHDDFIEKKIMQASEMILDHIGSAASEFTNSAGEIDSSTEVPYRVQAACLFLVGVLFKDTDGSDQWEPGWLPPAVTSMLVDRRKLTIA